MGKGFVKRTNCIYCNTKLIHVEGHHWNFCPYHSRDYLDAIGQQNRPIIDTKMDEIYVKRDAYRREHDRGAEPS